MGLLSFFRRCPTAIGNINIGDTVKVLTKDNIYTNYLAAAENLKHRHQIRWAYKVRPDLDRLFTLVDIIPYPATDDDRYSGKYIMVIEDCETTQIFMTNFYNLKLMGGPNFHVMKLK